MIDSFRRWQLDRQWKREHKFAIRTAANAVRDKLTLRCGICGRIITHDPADEIPERCFHGKTDWDYIPMWLTAVTEEVDVVSDSVQALVDEHFGAVNLITGGKS